MAKKKPITTNAMRILNAAKIEYTAVEYETDGTVSQNFGVEIAEKAGILPEKSFKTLVLRGEKNGIMVALMPVKEEINLRKFAAFVSDKKVELIAVKELLALTGYIRGSVSPFGMKKKYPTYIEKSCMDFPEVAVSAGICGCTLLLSPKDLVAATDATLFEN